MVLGYNDLQHPCAQRIAKAVLDVYGYPPLWLVCFEVGHYVDQVVEVAAGFDGDVRRCVGLVALAICVEKDSDDLLAGAKISKDQGLPMNIYRN